MLKMVRYGLSNAVRESQLTTELVMPSILQMSGYNQILILAWIIVEFWILFVTEVLVWKLVSLVFGKFNGDNFIFQHFTQSCLKIFTRSWLIILLFHSST